MMMMAMTPPQISTIQVSVGCNRNSTGSSTTRVIMSSMTCTILPVRKSRTLFTCSRWWVMTPACSRSKKSSGRPSRRLNTCRLSLASTRAPTTAIISRRA